ncbi:MAG: hypothetical protein QNJ37_17545 [Crocosphaera sp.]|nr:hypothetical protein [Crocosphaera sp.]
MGEAFYTYDVANVGIGTGEVTYSLRPKSTPEPVSVISLLGLGTLAAGSLLNLDKVNDREDRSLKFLGQDEGDSNKGE